MELSYYNVVAPASYGGLSKFKPKGDTKKETKDWLQTQDAYILQNPTRRRFPRRQVVVHGIDHHGQAELADLGKLWTSCSLRNFWNTQLVNSVPLSVCRRIGCRPDLKMIWNASLKFLKEHDVHFFTTYNEETKASIVERFIRTLKIKMWKYFTHRETLTYMDILSEIVASHNDLKMIWNASFKVFPVLSFNGTTHVYRDNMSIHVSKYLNPLL
jgi:hypothetical protein